LISLEDAGVLAGAGLAAGVVGTAGGITSLVSFPALLAVGVPILPANVTNLVSLVPGWPGSALASRPELHGRGAWLRRWSVMAVLGGALGAGLLLLTPSALFSEVVPWLILLASVALICQPRISAWRDRQALDGRTWVLPVGLVLVCLYNGYFGAGSGVMLLVLMLVLVERQVAVANALKNMLVGMATVVSAALFALFGHVYWWDAAPLAAGVFVGSTIGPWVARRLPGDWLRWLAALAGLGLAVDLWVTH
jgi:hypothetical protein